jgi:hypothetical protein
VLEKQFDEIMETPSFTDLCPLLGFEELEIGKP